MGKIEGVRSGMNNSANALKSCKAVLRRMFEYLVYLNVSLIFICILKLQIFVITIVIICILNTYIYI